MDAESLGLFSRENLEHKFFFSQPNLTKRDEIATTRVSRPWAQFSYEFKIIEFAGGTNFLKRILNSLSAGGFERELKISRTEASKLQRGEGGVLGDD